MPLSEEELTLAMVRLLQENEVAVGAYYAACATAFPVHRNQWLYLQAQEDEHALTLGKIEQAIKARPHLWKRGRVAPETVRFLAEEVRKKCAAVRDGKLEMKYALSFIIDVESSMIEKELLSAIQTGDVELEAQLLRLRNETEDHRQRLTNLLIACRTGGA